MAVRLEGSIKRWIGLSTDTKPEPGQFSPDGEELTSAELPAGSSFLESDTGLIYRWNGHDWLPGEGPVVDHLRAIEGLLREVVQRLPEPGL